MYASINFCNLIKKLALIIASLSIVSLLSISPAVAAVNGWEFSPQKPVSGDILNIQGSASPEEDVDAFVTFEKTVSVSGGEFEYILEDVKIPEGMDNRFTVEATGAKNLNVRVKIIVWVTKSSEASGNTAIVSQSSVPSGTYKIKIDGDAGEGVSKVKLKITAFQGIKADSNGKFTYSYSTKSIPSGDFDIKVGGITKTVTIKSKEKSGATSGSSSDSSSTDSSSTNSSSNGAFSNETSSNGAFSNETSSNGAFSNETSSNEASSNETSSNETSSNEKSSKETSSSSFSATETQSPVNSGKSKATEEKEDSEVTTQDGNLVEEGNNKQLSGKNIPASESSGQSTDKLYLLAGMGAGLLILIIYSRKK